MAKIKLIRIDDRLIHGQVVTRWIQKTNADRIVIVDNEVAKNEYLKKIYSLAAPSNINVETKSIKEFINEWLDNKMGSGKLLILLKNIDTAKKLIEKGLLFNELQIGGIGATPENKTVFKTVSITDNEAQKLKWINDKGIKTYFQVLPGEECVDLNRILKKHFNNLI